VVFCNSQELQKTGWRFARADVDHVHWDQAVERVLFGGSSTPRRIGEDVALRLRRLAWVLDDRDMEFLKRRRDRWDRGRRDRGR